MLESSGLATSLCRDGTGTRNEKTYLWIEFIDPSNSFFHSTFLDSITDIHSFLYQDLVDLGRLASFFSERNGGIGKAFDDEVVQHQGVHITVESISILLLIAIEEKGGTRVGSEVLVIWLSSSDLGEIPTCYLDVIRKEEGEDRGRGSRGM